MPSLDGDPAPLFDPDPLADIGDDETARGPRGNPRDPRWERRQPRRAVIAVTAYAEDADRARCAAAGIDACIAKPLRFEALRRALAAVLAGEPRPAPAPPAAPDGAAGALLDLEAARELLEDGGWEAGLIGRFAAASHGRLEHLRAAAAARDAAGARRAVHNLKGSCDTFGAAAMAGLATRLYALDGDAPLAALDSDLERLGELLAQTQAALETVSRKLSGSPPPTRSA